MQKTGQTIKTAHTSTKAGAGRMVAKGEGKQRTVNYDHSLSVSKNHANAAAELGNALGWKPDEEIAVFDGDTYTFRNYSK